MFLRSKLAETIDLRHTPELTFQYERAEVVE